MVNVLLADRDPVLRRGLSVLLTSHGFDVAEVAAGRDVAGAHRPDVLVAEASEIKDIDIPGTPILMFTDRDDIDSVYEAIQSGVRGYLHKSANLSSILRAVRAVAAGELVFGPHLAQRLRDLLARTDDTLTLRQRQILELAGQGLGNAAIGKRLGVSAKTISNQVPGILAALGLPDRAAAVQWARQHSGRLAC
jgi:DNA-binding NarL/FixJ family response regulator